MINTSPAISPGTHPVYLNQEIYGVRLAFLALDPLDTLDRPPHLGLLPGGARLVTALSGLISLGKVR